MEKAEKRLDKRETNAVKNLHQMMMKRPGRLATMLTAGKALRTWRKAIEKQKKVVAQIRANRSTAHKIRTQQSHYRNAIKTWIRSRAVRIDSHAVREYEAEQERKRQHIEVQRIEKIRAITLQREKSRELTNQQGITLQRMPTKAS